jgi:hypothetical protein
MTAAEMGRLGGASKQARLTPQERSEMARLMAEARWTGEAQRTNQNRIHELQSLVEMCKLIRVIRTALEQRMARTPLQDPLEGIPELETDRLEVKLLEAQANLSRRDQYISGLHAHIARLEGEDDPECEREPEEPQEAMDFSWIHAPEETPRRRKPTRP